jgi:uncharacterized membrane protein
MTGLHERDELSGESQDSSGDEIVSSARLETFADGVFAIAITLLVLEIHIPSESEPVWDTLRHQGPSFLAYITSFLTIGTMWANHHRIFTVIRGTTYGFLFVNILLLMPIAFLPYPTAVFAQHFNDAGGRFAATMLYAGTMALISVLYGVLWGYAASHGLVAPEAFTSRAMRRRSELVYRLAPFIYLAGGLASVIHPAVSLAVFIALAIYWIYPAAATR